MRPERLSETVHELLSDEKAYEPPPFHGDPADQIIVATARDQGATILTKDRLLLDYDDVLTLW